VTEEPPGGNDEPRGHVDGPIDESGEPGPAGDEPRAGGESDPDPGTDGEGQPAASPDEGTGGGAEHALGAGADLADTPPQTSALGRVRRPSRLRRILQVAGGLLLLLLLTVIVLYLTSPNGSEYRRAWPKRTAYMQLRIDEARQAGRPLQLRYEPVPMSRIPRTVQRAVLVAEDAGFYGHGAFDWSEMRAAVEQAWREGESPRGASTITQQLARNLYLSPRRSLWRKVREAFIAVRLEHALSKHRILELYLNVIELGRGVFGVEAASESYFGEPVDAVDREQAVRLAATIPSPLHDNPDTNTREYRWRIGLIGPRAFPAESAAADTGVAGVARADTSITDSLLVPSGLPAPGTASARPDTLQADTLRPDTLGPDTLRPDTFRSDIRTVGTPGSRSGGER
jgi:monofunctional glycosyltransferase